jgi:hypothetical protein
LLREGISGAANTTHTRSHQDFFGFLQIHLPDLSWVMMTGPGVRCFLQSTQPLVPACSGCLAPLLDFDAAHAAWPEMASGEDQRPNIKTIAKALRAHDSGRH